MKAVKNEKEVTAVAPSWSPCLIIPLYNHPDQIAKTLEAIAFKPIPSIIINDGSQESVRQVLLELEAKYDWLKVLHHTSNQGKGAAVLTGMRYATDQGFTHAVQMDADGQHDIGDLASFLSLSKEKPDYLILGSPVFDDSAPFIRVWGRKISNHLLAIETSSKAVDDALCGYRLYPLAATLKIANKDALAMRMGFDLEVLVRLIWSKVPVANIRTKVIYPKDGVSHFNYLRDNLSLFLLHIRLLFLRFFKNKSKANHTIPNWSQVTEKGSTISVKLLQTLYLVLGKKVCLLLLHPVSFYYLLFGRKARKSSKEYLARIYHHGHLLGYRVRPPTLSDSYWHFYEFGANLLNKLSVWNSEICKEDLLWDQKGRSLFYDFLSENQGAVLLSAHYGNIDIGRALINSGARPAKVNPLMFKSNAIRFNNLLRDLNSDAARAINVEDIGPQTIVQLQEKIKQGEFIAMLADRLTPGAPQRSVKVPFLGKEALFPEGPFLLASMLECPIFTVFFARTDSGAYRIFFRKFSDRLVFPRKRRAEAIKDCVQKYVHSLEEVCHLLPYQWANFYDFWKI